MGKEFTELKLGVLDAIIIFNTGAPVKVKVSQAVHGEVGSNCVAALQSIEKTYIKKEMAKKARQAETNLKRKMQKVANTVQKQTIKCIVYNDGFAFALL